MKKLLASSCAAIATTLSLQIPANAQTVISTQENGLGLMVSEDPARQNGLHLYKVNRNGVATLLHENIFPDNTLNTFDASKSIIDSATGKVYLLEPPQGGVQKYRIYNAFTNEFEGYTTIEGVPNNAQPSFLAIPFGIQQVVDKNCESEDGVTCSSESVVSLGGSGGDSIATIDKEGLKVGGKSIVRREINVDGEEELHIGENSLVTVESNGVQKLYATDAEGNKIPINITEGSDLQINGVSVQGQLNQHTVDIQRNTRSINDNTAAIKKNTQSINDLQDDVNALGSGVAGAAALSAALSSLPTVSDDAPFSCGVGTGGYSSRYAMGVGCAARLSERLSFNAGGSVLFGGSSDYGQGSLDTVAGRAGFVFKLGTLTPSTKGQTNEQLQSKLKDVETKNAELAYQLESLQQRLNQLEALASGLTAPKVMATTTVTSGQ